MFNRFSKPDRSGYTPNLRKTSDNDQLDIGWDEGCLPDGRVYRIELWAQDGLTCVSIFTPTAEIENFSNRQFIELFRSAGLISWVPAATPSAYALPITDASGNSCWQVSVTLADEESEHARAAVLFRPYVRSDAPSRGAQPTPSGVTPDSRPGDLHDDDVEQKEYEEDAPDDLSEVAYEPDFLLQFGYDRRDEETTDTVRAVWYCKSHDCVSSQLRIVLRIAFELGISDEPHLSYEQAHSYSFDAVLLDVFDRRMEPLDGIDFDSESESPTLIGTARLKLTSLREVESLAKALEFSDLP